MLGVSADPSAKQKKFQEKYHLPFSLLADTEKKICNAFGVIKDKTLYGRVFKGISRMTLLRKRNASEIGFYQVGHRILYSKEKHLIPFLKACEK